MTELTTIRVEKPVVEWLNTLKGHLDYISGKKLTLNDALLSILAEMDWLYLKGQNVTKSKEKEVLEHINHRIDQFWGAENEEKPSIVHTDTGNIVIKEKEKKSKPNKSLLDMT